MVEKAAEVVIVGAGPVGLCLANLLGEAGIETLLLESGTDTATDLRASTFHPPTLEMLERLGVTDDVIAQGMICPTWQLRWHPHGERAVFDMSVIADETKYPYRLQCEQWKLSRLLQAQLEKRRNVAVKYASPVTTVRQGDGFAEVDAEVGGKVHTFRSSYVIGCDGVRSTVRKAIGQPLEGKTYPGTTIIATTPFPFHEHLEDISVVSYCWKDPGHFSLLRVPSQWRVGIFPKDGTPLDDQLTPEAIEESLQEIVPKGTPYQVNEKRAYTVHMRIVANYRTGRVLLAGDAAHINSPSGGMGLNGGLHDAFAVADVLIDVVKRGAAESRLDLYDRKRRPIAYDEILLQSDKNRARMNEPDPVRRRQIMDEFKAITSDRQRMKTYLMKSSMFDGVRRAAAVT
jgi:2-polyprenyl-6-methoxyphenol hydroxylase-like FAD-dependent oxidoreductase